MLHPHRSKAEDDDATASRAQQVLALNQYAATVTALANGDEIRPLTAKEQEIAENNIRAAIGPMVENPENTGLSRREGGSKRRIFRRSLRGRYSHHDVPQSSNPSRHVRLHNG